jgi:hypothetical protein
VCLFGYGSLFLSSSLHAKKITKEEEGESKTPDNEQKKRTDLGAARTPRPPKEKKKNGFPLLMC